MLNRTLGIARKYGSKAAALTVIAGASVPAFAQTATNPIVQMLEQIGLDGVAAAVIAMGVLIVGVAMAFKAPDVAKRGVKKV